jgi:pimeloyl-ACP methyl ester carboxylesterase
MVPTTRYVRSGDTTIAYQLAGEGKLDLLFLPGWISQIEQLWDSSALRRFLERLAVFSRLILFDRRGSGLSGSVGEPYTLEQEAGDALAVLNAAGSERAALFTYGLGGPVGALLAAGAICSRTTSTSHRASTRSPDPARCSSQAPCSERSWRPVRVRGPQLSRAQRRAWALAALRAPRLRTERTAAEPHRGFHTGEVVPIDETPRRQGYLTVPPEALIAYQVPPNALTPT